MTTIQIAFGVKPLAESFILQTITRGDNGLPPSGATLPLALMIGSQSGGLWPWTGSFTDNSPPPFYNATATLNGFATPPLTIDGVPASRIPPVIPYTQLVSVPQASSPIIPFPYTDVAGNPINLSGTTVSFSVFWSPDGGIDAPYDVLFTLDNQMIGGVTVTGPNNNIVQVQPPPMM